MSVSAAAPAAEAEAEEAEAVAAEAAAVAAEVAEDKMIYRDVKASLLFG